MYLCTPRVFKGQPSIKPLHTTLHHELASVVLHAWPVLTLHLSYHFSPIANYNKSHVHTPDSCLVPFPSTIHSTLASHNSTQRICHLTRTSSMAVANGNNGILSRFRQSDAPIRTAAGIPWLDQVRGMKTRSSVKRLCDGCKVGAIASSVTFTPSTIWERCC